MDSLQKALLVVASVRAALKNGCRHYDARGRLLSTEQAVMKTMRDEGKVTVDESGKIARTTDYAEFTKLCQQHRVAVPDEVKPG